METLGDDIAWMRFGEDGRLYAVNPEYGLFGVAPGTDWKTNPNAMRTLERGQLDLHQRGAHRRRRRLVGGHGRAAGAPHRLARPGLDAGRAASSSSHPNSRFCTPITQCPILAPEYDDPKGVPISAILFGGRRKTTIPLVTRRGTGCTASTWARRCPPRPPPPRSAQVGVVRRDPMAMLPFIGYNAGDYFRHWIEMGKGGGRAPATRMLPKIFYVNWFRRGEDGRFLWPGFGENRRVLKWIVRAAGGHRRRRSRRRSACVPPPEALDLDRPGHAARRTSRPRCGWTPDEWRAEIPQITEWFARFGDKLPGVLWAELDALKARLGVE